MSLIQLSPEAQAALQAVCFLMILLGVLLAASSIASVLALAYLLLRKIGVLSKRRKSKFLNVVGGVGMYSGAAFLAAILLLLLLGSLSGSVDALKDLITLAMFIAIASANTAIGWFARKNAQL